MYVDPNYHEGKPHFDDEEKIQWNKWLFFKWSNEDNPFPRFINQIALTVFSLAIGAEIVYLIYGLIRYGFYARF